MQTNILNRNKHESFLADHRKDPYTGELFKVGDKIVICAKCKTAYLESSWKVRGKCFISPKQCDSKETLKEIPKEKSITNLNGKTITKTKVVVEKKKSFPLGWILAIILGIVILANFDAYTNYKEKANSADKFEIEITSLKRLNAKLKNENSGFQNDISILKKDNSSLNNKLSRIREETNNAVSVVPYQKSISNIYKSPIVIEDIDFTSTNHDRDITYIGYGASLKKSKIYYLCPRIKYRGNQNKSIKLNVKIIKPDGSVLRGNSSPQGFSYSSEFTCNTGTNTRGLGGWGNKSGGVYGNGWHQIEFWYNDICVGYKKFYIYD